MFLLFHDLAFELLLHHRGILRQQQDQHCVRSDLIPGSEVDLIIPIRIFPPVDKAGGFPGFHGRRYYRCLHIVFDRRCTASKRDHSNSSVPRLSCSFCLDLILTGILLNSGNLFFGRVCVTSVVQSSNRSVTNLVNYSFPMVSIILTVLATWVSLVPTTSRSWLHFRKLFPISSSTVTSALTSLSNAAWTPDRWSW